MPRISIDTRPEHNAELFFWKITESVEELSELMPDGKEMLDEVYRRFKSPQRRKEWLATRALLQSTPHNGSKIVYNTNGAPQLSDGNKQISISHTKELIAIAISDTRVGIDIEHEERDALSITRLFLTEKEKMQFSNDSKDEALRLWTTKEAAFKLASENATVLKEIETELTNEENGVYTYKIKYPNEKKAICRTYITDGLFISVSSLQE